MEYKRERLPFGIYWRVIIGVVELLSKKKMACAIKSWAKGCNKSTSRPDVKQTFIK